MPVYMGGIDLMKALVELMNLLVSKKFLTIEEAEHILLEATAPELKSKGQLPFKLVDTED